MRKVHWTNKARLDYYKNIDYLLKRWSKKEAQKFIDRVKRVEDILEVGMFEFERTNFNSVRRCVIIKQISLFYQISNNEVFLLRLWNNSMNTENLKF